VTPEAESLKRALEHLSLQFDWTSRIAHDPVEFPRRYGDARDAESVGLITAAFSYGRPVSFKACVESVLQRLGPHPARRLTEASLLDIVSICKGFVYRFHRSADLAILLIAIAQAQRRHGSLEAVYLLHAESTPTLRNVHAFSKALRSMVNGADVERHLGPAKALSHLLPTSPSSASKRLNLFVRWMVRGPDTIDLGHWKKVSPSQLMMPLDTHIVRLASWLRLTKRKTVNAAMVEEVTESMRALWPGDPVRLDFVLCHFGMSGQCPSTPVRTTCQKCALRRHCQMGQKALKNH
jgi:uncharacterized protein (TIGR02757 family)